MTIREQIEKLYKQSILDKKPDLTNTLRLIKSAIKDKDIEVRTKGVKDGIKEQEIFALLQNLVKQRKDSIESFKTANRQDLIEKEQNEIEIIQSFLPTQKDEKETENIIKNLIEQHN